MASLAELKDLIKQALGTPETVNFKALNRLLVCIVQRLGVLYKKIDRTDSIESVDGGKKVTIQATKKKEKDKLRKDEPRSRKISRPVKDAEKKDLNEKSTSESEEKTGSQKSPIEKFMGTDKEKEPGLEEDTKGEVSPELNTGTSEGAISNGEKKDKGGKERKESFGEISGEAEEAEDRDGKRREVSKQSKKPAPSSKTEDCDYNGKEGTTKRTKKKSEDSGSLQAEDLFSMEDTGTGTDYEDDFDNVEDSASGSDPSRSINEYVPKQDFHDVVNRVKTIERAMDELQILHSKGKAPWRQDPNVPNPTQALDRAYKASIAQPQVSVQPQVTKEALEKLEALTKKRIELVGKEVDAKIDLIKDDIDAMMAQLDILPKPCDLYKSYFPSWKMLEDILCKARPLKNNIQEIKDSYDMQTGSGITRQMTKFLGSAGPPDALYRVFEDIATLIDRHKKSQLSFEVSEVKKEVTSKKMSRVTSQGSSKQKKSLTMEALSKFNTTTTMEESTSTEVSDDYQEHSMSQIDRLSTTNTTVMDGGYLTFKVARLAEDIMGVRKEIDDTQLWKDRIRVCEEDIGILEDMITGVKRDAQLKEERDHEILTILQTDMCELQNEVCGNIQKQTRQAHKEQMDNFRQTINVDQQQPSTMPGMVIDREARIRTQQLQMQVNALHHIVVELQLKAPDVVMSQVPTSLPTDARHPWGTGRQGPGTNMRSGVGTTAAATSPAVMLRGSSPSPSPPNNVAIMEDRPAPLGGREDKDPKSKCVYPCEALTSKKDEEERTRMQQAITRLNTAHSLMTAKLESCCNQQSMEHRRLQDLMTRMHRDNLNRHGELQAQIAELMGEEIESLPPGEEMEQGLEQPETIEHVLEVPASPREVKQPDSPQPQSKSGSAAPTLKALKISSANAIQTAVLSVRKEVFGYLKNVYARIKRLEACLPEMLDDVDPGAVKRPILHRFQCLSCDKRVDYGNHPRGEGAVPLCLPELPRMVATSPPRQRSASTRSSAPRAKPIDLYEIPRQCGGSYTSSAKPRRIHYYNSLGEAIEVPPEPVAVERVDVKGTDGHIYKGQTRTKYSFNTSNNFAYSDERRTRLISLLQRKTD